MTATLPLLSQKAAHERRTPRREEKWRRIPFLIADGAVASAILPE